MDENDFHNAVHPALANAQQEIITRYVVVTESMDLEGDKWLTTHAYDAAGEPLTDWDYRGMLHAGLDDHVKLSIENIEEDDDVED